MKRQKSSISSAISKNKRKEIIKMIPSRLSLSSKRPD